MSKWSVTADKFLSVEQVSQLTEHLLMRRDLAIARGNDKQAIKNYYMIRTLLETGVRVFEFTALTLSDLQGQKIVVRHGKGDKPRTVLLTKTTMLMLREWLTVRAKLGFTEESTAPLFPSRFDLSYTTRGVQKVVKIVFKEAGLPEHLSAHSLRHTYCSLLLASGKVGITTVQANLGHSSIAITNLYSHAVGIIEDDVELYKPASSPNTGLSELRCSTDAGRSNKTTSAVKAFCRNVNLK